MTSDSESQPAAGVYPADWSTWTRHVAFVGLLIALVVAIVALKFALAIVVLGAILAFVLYFPASFLARHTPLRYGLSVTLVFLLYLALLVVVFLVFVPPLVIGLLELVTDIGAAVEQAGQFLLDYVPGQSNFDFLLGPLSAMVKARVTAEEIQVQVDSFVSNLGGLIQAAGNIGALILKLLTLHLFALFTLLELPKLFAGAMERLSPAYRHEASILTARMSVKWTRYFWAMILFGLLVGAWNFLQLTVLGIPGAPVVGVITGLLALVPVVGPFINIFVIGAVALIQGSTTLALHSVALAALAVVINLIFVAIVAELILPKIWGSAVSLPTIVIIPGVVIGAALLGPLGALISVPLLGFISDLVGYTVHKIRGGDPYPGESEPVFFQGLYAEGGPSA
jgi:predicted PurR-regulated permease PerM